MKFKTTYILFAVLGLMLILLAVAMWNATPPPDNSLYALPGAHDAKHPLEVGDVDRVEIKRVRPHEETLVFAKDPESSRWQIVEPRPLRAGPAVGDLVSEVLNATRDQEADLPAGAGAAGLEPPAEVITLKKGDERSLQLNVGNVSSESSTAVIYVNSPERPKEIIPVLRSKLAMVLKNLNDFRDPYLLAASPSDYQFVKLTLDKTDKKDAPKGSLVLDKKEEGLWEYKDPEGYDGSAEEGDAGVPSDAHKPPSGVSGLLKELSELRVENTDKASDFVEDDAKDLGQYNLDPAKSEVLVIDIDRIESLAKDESGAQKPKTARLKLLVGVGKKVGDKTDKYYAALQGEHGNTVVKVAAAGPDSIVLLFKDPTLLCNHNLAALGSFKKPVAVNVVNGSGKLEFRRETGDSLDWRLYRDGAEVAADGQAISAFVNQLVQPNQVRSFLDPKTADPVKLGLEKPAAVVSIWVDGVVKEEEKKDESKDKDAKDKTKEPEKEPAKKPKLVLEKDKVDKPTARLTFGAVEDKLVVVKREANHKDWSESALVKAPDLLLTQAQAGPLAYYDKKLPKFSQGFDLPDKGVVKLTLDRNGEHFVISRAEAKPESPWKFDEPKDMAGRKADPSAVQSILTTLDGLKATRLVAENPKEEDLDKEYGLKTPAVQAVVTKDDKTSYTYEFGKDAADGEYALQSQRPKMVFVVSKFDLEPLQKELQDRTIFAFDRAKVKTLKMTGWQKTSGGELLTRDLERKDDKAWTVKDPAKLEMNFDKVSKLVEELSHLQAERFVTRNPAIKAAYDKDEQKSVFTVEMTVEGEKEPLVLKVVDLTGDKALPEPDRQVYATTPKLPGELFQVKRTIFTAPADKPQEIGPMDQAAYFAK